MMLGMAIRMATDLNLHRKSVPCGVDTEEGRARDLEVNPSISRKSRMRADRIADYQSRTILATLLHP